jgi:hypothetical protein
VLPVVKVISHAPQESVVYTGRPLTVYFSAHAPELTSVSTTVTFNDNEIITNKALLVGQDFTGRMPVECYVLTISPSLWNGGGTLVVSITATTSTGSATDSVTLKTFPDIESTEAVTDLSSLATALSTIAGSAFSHTLVTMTPGNYVFPPATSLDTNDAKLVTFRPLASGDVAYVEDADAFVRRARWEDIRFRATSLLDPCIKLGSAGHSHFFTGCRFTNEDAGSKSGTFGVIVPVGAWANVDMCHFSSLGTAVVGADVVRNTFWNGMESVVFQNVRRVIEGTVGSGSPSVTWAYYDSAFSPSIRHNVGLLSAVPSILKTDAASSFSNVALVGNSFLTTGSDGLRLLANAVNNNYIVHNTLRTATGTGTGILVGTTRPVNLNFAVNNFLTSTLDNPASWGGDNIFDHNASEGVIRGDNSLSSITPLFANTLGLLQQNSPLLAQALTQAGVGRAFGTLLYQSQIGAVPFHPDSANASVLSHVANWPEFQTSLP